MENLHQLGQSHRRDPFEPTHLAIEVREFEE